MKAKLPFVYSLFVLLLAFTTQSSAQIVIADIAGRVNGSDYIFEGKVIRANSYWNENRNFIYTSLTVDITKVFKGNIHCGSVELITQGGSVDDTSLEISHNLVLEKGDMGIFMCRQTDMELPLVDYYPESNLIKLDAKYDQQSFIKYFNDTLNKLAIDYQYSFDSLAQVYNLVELYTQINYVDCFGGRSIFEINNDQEITESHEKILTPQEIEARKEEEILQYQKKLKRFHEDLDRLRASVQVQRTTDVQTNATLTFTFQNQQITTISGTKYFEFDLSLSDNADSIYFMTAIPTISYDTLIFGSNIDFNHGLTISRGTVLQDTLSYHDPYAADQAANIFDINLIDVAPNSTVNYYALSTTPTVAVHVKMKIQNCFLQGTVDILWSLLSIYGTDPTNPNIPLSVYNNAVFANNLVFAGCGSTGIGNISPSSVRGGVGDVVTISGIGFGATQGTGKVFLKNADNGGQTYMPLDSMDILSWSDTQIQFTCPSVADSMNVNKGGVGSGKIRVKNNAGTFSTASPNDSLIIRFAATNQYSNANDTAGPKMKFFINLVNPPNTNSYIFRPDTNFSHHTDRLSCLGAAIHDWVCLTAVNFKLGNDTINMADSTSVSLIDGVNYFKFAKLPGGVLARTYQWSAYNRTSGCNTGWEYEIDLVASLDSAQSFFCDTSKTHAVPSGKYDFYNILLHELGHAHSLKHVNDPTAVMWWQADQNGATAVQRKIRLYTDASAIEGGNFVVTQSLTFTPAVCSTGGATVMSLDTAGNCTAYAIGISELLKPDVKFSLYPNPSTDHITISCSLERSSIVEVGIYDYLGRMVYGRTKNKQAAGTYTERINVLPFSDGFYFVKLSVNNFDYTKKFIKHD